VSSLDGAYTPKPVVVAWRRNNKMRNERGRVAVDKDKYRRVKKHFLRPILELLTKTSSVIRSSPPKKTSKIPVAVPPPPAGPAPRAITFIGFYRARF